MPSNEEHTPLLSCPFCGGEAEIHDATRISGIWNLIHRCDAVGPIQAEFFDREHAIESWNRRAGEAALVEALEALLADMMEILASPDQLEMAAYLAKQGRPAIGEEIDGPETIKRAREVLVAAKGEG